MLWPRSASIGQAGRARRRRHARMSAADRAQLVQVLELLVQQLAVVEQSAYEADDALLRGQMRVARLRPLASHTRGRRSRSLIPPFAPQK